VFLHYRSLRDTLAPRRPFYLATLWIFGAMGWLGIPLGRHLDVLRHRARDRRRLRHSLPGARAPCSRGGANRPGPACRGNVGAVVVADTLAVGSGFGLLAASQVPANAHLGVLVVAGLVESCILTLLVLGSILCILETAPAGRSARSSRVPASKLSSPAG
jgi:hypothetical protein